MASGAVDSGSIPLGSMVFDFSDSSILGGNMHPAGIVLILALIAALLLLRSEWEKRHFKTEHYSFKSGKLHIGIRLLFLSDMHGVSFGRDNEELISKIKELDPDLILLGGDMITCGKKHAEPPSTSACIELCRRLGEKYPVYYAEGNHEQRFRKRFPEDFQIFIQHLEQNSRVHYLCNQEKSFVKRDAMTDEADRLDIYGASIDPVFFMRQKPGFGNKEPMDEGYLQGLFADSKGDRAFCCDRHSFSLLMLHSPLYLKQAEAFGADLVLSGHFHGGTIRLPYLGGLMTPQLQFFVRECSGTFRSGDTNMVVNRGLGTHSIRIRLNDRPELSLIDILPKGDGI